MSPLTRHCCLQLLDCFLHLITLIFLLVVTYFGFHWLNIPPPIPWFFSTVLLLSLGFCVNSHAEPRVVPVHIHSYPAELSPIQPVVLTDPEESPKPPPYTGPLQPRPWSGGDLNDAASESRNTASP